MTYQEWTAYAQRQLEQAGSDSARLDALMLLERASGRDRAAILAHPEATLSPNEAVKLEGELNRRLVHEPMSYILGKKEFYGREFYVSHDVLEPRPETEDMIDLLKRLAPAQARVADIGTGSGALAVTAALETGAQVAATDIDPACLQVTERNAGLHNANLELMAGSLLEPFLQKSCNFEPDVLLANLPYVPDEFPINQAAQHEPALALFGGPDGLELYRQMFAQALALAHKPALILCESLLSQHTALEAVATKHGYRLQTTTGLIQAFTAA